MQSLSCSHFSALVAKELLRSPHSSVMWDVPCCDVALEMSRARCCRRNRCARCRATDREREYIKNNNKNSWLENLHSESPLRLAGRFSVLGCCSEKRKRRELGTPSFYVMSSWSLFLLVPPLAWADVPSWAVEVEVSFLR